MSQFEEMWDWNDDDTPAFDERPLVYVAAPYTIPDPVENTHHAVVTVDLLASDGKVTPVCPHLSMAWHLVRPHEPQFWLDYDLALLARCDALLRLPGTSKGADDEVAYALENDIPVFGSVLELYAWVDDVCEDTEGEDEDAS